MGRGVGDEAPLVHPRGQDVTAAAAADEDLASPVGGPLEQQGLCAASGGEDRGHGAGRSRPDYRDAATHVRVRFNPSALYVTLCCGLGIVAARPAPTA